MNTPTKTGPNVAGDAAACPDAAQVLDTIGSLFVELSTRLAIIQRQANTLAAEKQPAGEGAFAIGHLLEGAGLLADIGAALANGDTMPVARHMLTWFVGGTLADEIAAVSASTTTPTEQTGA